MKDKQKQQHKQTINVKSNDDPFLGIVVVVDLRIIHDPMEIDETWDVLANFSCDDVSMECSRDDDVSS